MRWAPDGRELYYVDPDARLMAVRLTRGKGEQALQASTPEALFTTHLAYGANITGSKPQYAVARNGRFLLNVRLDETPCLSPSS